MTISSAQTTFISKLKTKYGVDLAKSVERLAHNRFNKNAPDEEYVSDINLTSDSLPLELFEQKQLQDAHKQLGLGYNEGETVRNLQNRQGTPDERAKFADKYNFFLNKDFISELLDVDPLAVFPV